MSAAVLAYGAVTGLGGLDATWEGLLAGRSAARMVEFPGLSGPRPAVLADGVSGPVGSVERLEALVDVVADMVPPLTEGTRLLVASTKGAVDEIFTDGEAAGGQPAALAGMIAARLGIADPGCVVSAACASGTIAIGSAVSMIDSGAAAAVLVVGIDLVSRFVVSGFDSLKALAAEACRPFDRDRDGLVLGEGAGFVLLAGRETAAAAGWRGGLCAAGFSSSCDAVHITAPCREASGLGRTLAAFSPDAPGAINGHGTGTVYNDAMEVRAFNRFAPEVPFYSVKGAIGHCLGAAGVIEAAVSLKSIEEGVVPPTVGLKQPDTGAEMAARKPAPLARPAVISCNSGFGGINAAVMFAAEP